MSAKEALRDVSKSLFTASEALREALDTIDLNGLSMNGFVEEFERIQKYLELKAQFIQRVSKSIK